MSEEKSKDKGTNKDNDKDKDKDTQYNPPILHRHRSILLFIIPSPIDLLFVKTLELPTYILFWPRLTRLMSKDPLVSVVISSMSNGSKIRLSFVQVMNWKGGWDSM